MFKATTKFNNLSIRYKIIVPISLFLAIGLFIGYFAISIIFKNRVHSLIAESGETHASLITSSIHRLMQTAEWTAVVIAEHPDVSQRIYSIQDDNAARRELRKLLAPLENTLQKSGKTKVQIHFHRAPALSLLRSWIKPGDPREGGDDLSGFRPSILEVVKTRKSLTTIEVGRGGIFIRGITPIMRGDDYIGSVEVTFPLKDAIDSDTHDESQEFALLLTEDSFKTYARFKGGKPDKEIGEAILLGGNYLIGLTFKNLSRYEKPILGLNKSDKFMHTIVNRKILYLLPLEDYKKGHIGYLVVVKDISKDIATLRNLQIIMLSVMGVSLAILVLFLHVTVQWIISHLGKTTERLEEIASGSSDLTLTLDVYSDDEIGTMSTSFNHFVDRINHIIGIVQGASSHLSASCGNMSQISRRFLTLTQEQSALVEEITATVDEMNASSEHIDSMMDGQAESLNQLFGSMKEVTVIITAMESLMNETMNLTARVSKDASIGEAFLEKMNSGMLRIQDSASRMTGVLGIIRGISDQINLLSLNAAIEAARAGESGRGFAVVADEISRLAEKTNQSIREIDSLIGFSVKETSDGMETSAMTVETIKTILADVDSIKVMMEKLSDEMSRQVLINNDMNEFTNKEVRIRVETVSQSAREQKNALHQILTSITHVNELSAGIAKGSDEISNGMQELSDISDLLQESTGSFKVKALGEDFED